MALAGLAAAMPSRDLESQPPAIENQALSEVMQRNIRALIAVRQEHEAKEARGQRFAQGVSRWAGSLWSVYAHAALFGGWVLFNSGAITGIKPLDPFPFVGLAMWASVEAIFLSIFVLISQNRSAEVAEARADLDVQINLLAEHEITHLVRQIDAIAAKLQVQVDEAQVEQLKKDVDLTEVLQQIKAVNEGNEA